MSGLSGRDDLLRALNELEALQKVSRGLPSESRREILDFRRKIAAQNVKIAEIGEAAFTMEEQRRAFRDQLAKLRYAIAAHMAAWPVVSIDHDNAAYVASLAAHREAYQIFTSWVRNALR